MHRSFSLAKFEFMSNFSLKTDLISFALIALVLLLRVWTVDIFQANTPIKLGLFTGHPVVKSAINSNINMSNFETLIMNDNENELSRMLYNFDLDAYIIPCLDCQKPVLKIISINEVNADNYLKSISKSLSDTIFPIKYSLSNEEYILISEGFSINFINSDNKDSSNAKTLTMVLMFLLCISVLTAFSLLFQGITMEKEEKITEMYISSMKVSDWVDGKVLAALGIALKGLVIYFSFAVIGLDLMGVVSFSHQDVMFFLTDRFIPLLLSFSIGFVFWCYFYSYISVIISKASSSVKSSAVLLPLTAFGIIFSVSDYTSHSIYNFLCAFPITYVFAMPSKIMSTEFDFLQFLSFSSICFVSIILIRKLTYKSLKFI